jgi:hypothetical protein
MNGGDEVIDGLNETGGPDELNRWRMEAMRSDLRTVLSVASGRRVFGRIFRDCFMYSSTFAAGSFDMTAYLEGKRDAANLIANAMREIDPVLVAECEAAYDEFERSFMSVPGVQSD